LIALLTAIVATSSCTTRIPYSGRVVDRMARPVPTATVIGYAQGPTPIEFVSIGGPVESDGTFSLPSTTKLQKIPAVSAAEKHEVTLKDPKPTGNVIVLP
jgi:hypothetical protein